MDKPKFEFSIIQLMNRLGEQAPEWDSVTRCPNGKSERLGRLRTNEYTLRITEDGKSELVHLWVYVEPAENNTHLITADVTINHTARRMVIENTLCDEPVTGFVYQAISVFIKEMYKHRAEHKPEGPKPKTKLEVAAEKLADASEGIQAEIDEASQKIDTEQPEKQDTRPNNTAREISDEWIDSHPTLTFAEQIKLAEVITSTSREVSKQDRDRLQKYLSCLFAEELHEKCIANGDFRIRGDAYVSSQPNNPETRKYWKRYVLTYPGIVYEAYMLEATKLSTANFKSYVLLALNMKDGYVRDCLLRTFTVSKDTGISSYGPIFYLIVKPHKEFDYLSFAAGEPINIALANISYAEISRDAVLDWFWNGWGEPDKTPTAVNKSEGIITPDTTVKKADADADADYKWVKHVGGEGILIPTETVKGFIKYLFSSLVEPGLPANKDPEKIRWHIFYGVYQVNQYIGFTEYTYAGEAVDWVFFRNPALDQEHQTGYACLIMFRSGKYVDTYIEFSINPDNTIGYGASYHARVEDHKFKIDSESGGTHYPSMYVLLDLCYDYILEQAKATGFVSKKTDKAKEVTSKVAKTKKRPADEQTDTYSFTEYGDEWVKHREEGPRTIDTQPIRKCMDKLLSMLSNLPGVPCSDDKIEWSDSLYGITKGHNYSGFDCFWCSLEIDPDNKPTGEYRWVFYRNPKLDEGPRRIGYSCLIYRKPSFTKAFYVEFLVDDIQNYISYADVYNVFIYGGKVHMATNEVTDDVPLPCPEVLSDMVYDYVMDRTEDESTEETQEQTSKPTWLNTTAGETEFIDDDVLHEELTKKIADEFYRKGVTSSLGEVLHADSVSGDNYWRVFEIAGTDKVYKTFMLRTPSFDAGAGLGYAFLVVGITDDIVQSGLIEQVRVYKHEGFVVEKSLSIGTLQNGRLYVTPSVNMKPSDDQELLEAKKSLNEVLSWFRASYEE